MKSCIFYLPYKLDEHGRGARMLRPLKMIQAFKYNGYDVFVIEGIASERKKKISEIKHLIKQGKTYDFMYTESHTIPTLLTDPGHLPLHPFMDFNFFNYMRKHKIRIGLFYCDIYWKFDNYGEGLSIIKKYFALLNYHYDINKYKKYLSKFYIPDIKICSYLDEPILTKIASELPPGADDLYIKTDTKRTGHDINLFYVGGIGNQYEIVELVKAVSKTEKASLTICCREDEWEREKSNYEMYLCDRVSIIHKNSDELEPYYEKADICSLLFKNDVYREMAKPFKAYEYLAHEKPVLSTKGTAIGKFVEENNIGWNIPFEADEIAQILEKIISDSDLLRQKIKNCKITKEKNLWTSRARQVAEELMVRKNELA